MEAQANTLPESRNKRTVKGLKKETTRKPRQPVVRPKRGRPPENKVFWRSVLRLPEETAIRLKAAVDNHNKERDSENQLSINTTLTTIIEVWLNEEGL